MTSADRFAFGKNWQAFLQSMDEQRIDRAIDSLRTRLQTDDLSGKRFLDIGCGSGLFSLAAHRMKADVRSIDFDPQCVGCTESLKQTYGSSDPSWTIQQGSVLDESMMQSLGTFDVVYSWGVLHHTGQMEQAIELASQRVAENGIFFIAIYNDQGLASRRWLRIKQTYHRLPSPLRSVWVGFIAAIYETKFALARAAAFRNPLPLADWRAKKDDRGMSVWHDWVDWVGGLPFEVATPDQIVNQMKKRGFTLENLTTVGKGWGCNEYVFRRVHVT
ncbi:bifunctional 3-demethylubiquinone-9 3-methyltransferase/ 2-octaprenyl-6-hydroxy phenol methylase [Rubripirellula obstinata]|uniref:Bifunctional 3-demethylubiquinone-9 3-methyltransferase/ 2-octaprenyl-6-hydroxy phenol methylase n=1 Tax=Rubripirellula obstinata TaxID=406547 RepID=A0A5B1CNE2_9BACT|nr:methyltransferase domain-containing protein [Rubripirellula obstinata]KAA1260873.1 bifunctional 3-demethylubiquinone-9 3-methyltransferase/ 2-octaprenyl-6-hydroxy phenol methylase [Rubripirellula obstinata]